MCRPITLQLSVAMATCRKTCLPQIFLLQYEGKPYLDFQNLGCHCKILGCHFDTQKWLKKHWPHLPLLCNCIRSIMRTMIVFSFFEKIREAITLRILKLGVAYCKSSGLKNPLRTSVKRKEKQMEFSSYYYQICN